LDVNLAAADEIARQLRLRDMGGIIVVDFIDMHEADNRQKLCDRMRENMSKVRAKHIISTFKQFGLLQ
jgi:ribonuclease G